MKRSTTIGTGTPKRPVGYCGLHHCPLTATEVRARECLGKQCRHFRKVEDHPWWQQREEMRKKRKARKDAIDKKVAAAMGGV